MAATASEKPNLEKKNLPRIEADVYSKIALNELIVFAVHTLQEQEVTATVEEVVSACFRLFPQGFSLKNYFYWPDSALVTRHLNEAKDKGYIKGNLTDGFALKVLGRQIAKQTAKSLGIPEPIRQKVKKPKPAAKIPEPVKVLKPQAKKKAAVSKAEKSAAPVKEKEVSKKQVIVNVKKKPAPKKAAPKQTKPVKKVIVQKVKPEKAPVVLITAPPKKTTAPKPGQKQKSAEKKKLPAPVIQKGKPVQKKEKPQEKPRVQKAQPAQQLSLLMPVAAKEEVKPVKKAIVTVTAKPKTVKAEKPVVTAKTAPILQIPAVSKEEKVKAGKVLHMLERSDAYRLYKKQGEKARISEFDFRNMLFATMESSAETLKRNVELFKRYAGIHNRQDLTSFLNFSESSFAPLLKPTGKKTNKKK